MKKLNIPISEEEIRDLRVGDAVQISGIATTGRDAAHKYMVETLIKGAKSLSGEDQTMLDELNSILNEGAIYHCGPIVRNDEGTWSIVSSGPTTSIRDEIYQDKVIEAFKIRVVIGKGGMGPRTLAACQEFGAVYLHGIGGAGVYNAAAMVEVIDVFKKEEFGLPEAFWKVRFEDFAGIVTMDSHGRSLHVELGETFDKQFKSLIFGEDEHL